MNPRRKPRALTLTLPNAKQPFFVLEGKKYTLRNLSEDGVGLWVRSPAPFGIVPGARLNGDVVIGNDIFAVGLEIRHISANVVGFKFVNAPDALRTLFKQLMEPAKYAASLTAHQNSPADDPRMNSMRLWYTGDAGSELVIWYNELSKMIQAVQVRWLGRVFYRGIGEPVQSAFLKEENLPLIGFRYAERDLINIEKTTTSEVARDAMQFLSSVPKPLPGAILWQFFEQSETLFLPEAVFEKSKVA